MFARMTKGNMGAFVQVGEEEEEDDEEEEEEDEDEEEKESEKDEKSDKDDDAASKEDEEGPREAIVLTELVVEDESVGSRQAHATISPHFVVLLTRLLAARSIFQLRQGRSSIRRLLLSMQAGIPITLKCST
jgi:FtsZ-interacting cell division protein YlmF